jgi:tRNA (pseudouridine54-N1)-methyltransferase
MREFIMRARRARTHGNIDLEHLSKEGKIDTICASVANALWISEDMRRDTNIHAVLEGPDRGPKTISFFGSDLRGVHYDERSLALIIKEALRRGENLALNEEAHVRAGVKVAKKSFERLVWEKTLQRTQLGERCPQLVVLDKNGEDIRKAMLSRNILVVFGSAEGLPPKTEKFMKDMGAKRVNIGPITLFASNCPVIINNELDRRYNAERKAKEMKGMQKV